MVFTKLMRRSGAALQLASYTPSAEVCISGVLYNLYIRCISGVYESSRVLIKDTLSTYISGEIFTAERLDCHIHPFVSKDTYHPASCVDCSIHKVMQTNIVHADDSESWKETTKQIKSWFPKWALGVWVVNAVLSKTLVTTISFSYQNFCVIPINLIKSGLLYVFHHTSDLIPFIELLVHLS